MQIEREKIMTERINSDCSTSSLCIPVAKMGMSRCIVYSNFIFITRTRLKHCALTYYINMTKI